MVSEPRKQSMAGEEMDYSRLSMENIMVARAF